MSSELYQEFKEIIADKCNNVSATAIVDYLYTCGVIDSKTMLRYVIRHEYYKRLKENKSSCFSIKLDLAVEYDISDTQVKRIIYDYTDIKV